MLLLLRHALDRIPALLREVALVGFAVLVYFGVRGQTEGRVEEAFANADEVLRAEEALGIDWGLQAQDLILGHDALVAVTNWVYVYGHWPVIAGAAVFLYARRRDKYVLLRNAMIVSGLIGFFFFAAYPVAPPRLAQPGIVDTVTLRSSGYRALQPPALTNQYAAMPSLHAGWNLLVGMVLFQATRHLAVRAFAVAMPAAMAFAVVATGNHFVLDVVVGIAVVLAAYLAVRLAETRTLGGGERPRETSDQAGEPSVRDRAQVRELAGDSACRGEAGSEGDRGGRTPLPRPPRGAPPEDDRPDPDSLGPLEAGEPRGPAPPRA
ncbi:MAG TPA: phosphatase PAP2 family protein [Gaiellaceae bacterium]|nr:phosphatase PAP2 family protein [Gaiellaceae bacterium]